MATKIMIKLANGKYVDMSKAVKTMKPEDKVHKVMREFKEGKLKSSSGHTVTSRDQAVAIAMSESGLSNKMVADIAIEYDKMEKANQLQTGTKIESEHKNTIKFIRNYQDKHGKLPPENEVYKHIAKDHLSEFKDYYTRLLAMEKEAEADMQKAKANHKYIKRIPKPSGKGYIYFYTNQQVKEYKEKGVVPKEGKKEEPKKERRGILGAWSTLADFFGITGGRNSDETKFREKIQEEYSIHKDELKDIDISSFAYHLNEYLSNKSKWDNKFFGEKKEKGEAKPKKETEKKEKPAISKERQKSGFDMNIMRSIAGIYGGEKKEEVKKDGTKKEDFTIKEENGQIQVHGMYPSGETFIANFGSKEDAEGWIDKYIERNKEMIQLGFDKIEDYIDYKNNISRERNKKIQEEKENIEKQAKEKTFNFIESNKVNKDYIQSLDAKNKALLLNELEKQNYRLSDGKIGSIIDIVNGDDFKTVSKTEVPRIKYDRVKYNRMDAKQQKIYEEKLKEKKNVYYLNLKDGSSYEIPKKIYDVLNKQSQEDNFDTMPEGEKKTKGQKEAESVLGIKETDSEELKQLKIEKSKLQTKAFKQISGSPIQKKTREEIDKLSQKIKEMESDQKPSATEALKEELGKKKGESKEREITVFGKQQKVKTKPIELNLGYEHPFEIAKRDFGNNRSDWVILESSTGLKVGDGKTQKDAIENAETMIKKYTKSESEFKQLVEKNNPENIEKKDNKPEQEARKQVEKDFEDKSSKGQDYIKKEEAEKKRREALKDDLNSSDPQKKYDAMKEEIRDFAERNNISEKEITKEWIEEERKRFKEDIKDAYKYKKPKEAGVYKAGLKELDNIEKYQKEMISLKEELLGPKMFKALLNLRSELMLKAQPTKYIKRIPNPKGKGWIYFYTPEQVKAYEKNGTLPDQKNKPEVKKDTTTTGKSKIEILKEATKKVANIMAEALSGKDAVQPTGSGVEQTGENIAQKSKEKKNIKNNEENKISKNKEQKNKIKKESKEKPKEEKPKIKKEEQKDEKKKETPEEQRKRLSKNIDQRLSSKEQLRLIERRIKAENEGKRLIDVR